LLKNGDISLIDFSKTSNTKKRVLSRQTMNAKIHSQKGNSPDYPLRPLKVIKCKKYKRNVITTER
jgi:hypothetical protein